MAAKRFKITDDEALSIVRSRVQLDRTSAHRRPFERTALRNRLFYMGRQWLVEDPRTGAFREPRSGDSRRVFYQANLVLGKVLRSVLTVAQANGEFVVPPAKATRIAEKAAWVSTKLFEHMSYVGKQDELDELACLIAAIDGSAIWKVHWDPELGETSRFYWDDPSGKRVLLDADERTIAEKEEAGHYEDLAMGEVRADIYSLFQSWWDWKARDRGLMDAEWFATADLVSRDAMREQYGEVVDKVTKTDGREGPTYYSELLSFMSGQYGRGTSYTMDESSREEDDKIPRCEMWEVPRPSNGNLGRYVVTLGDVVVENRDNPYRVTKYPIPFVRQNWITCPDRFWGISLLEQLAGPQRQYNMARSKKIQHLNAYGQPMTFVPNEWDVPQHFVTTEPGALVRYDSNKGGELKHGPNPMLPKEVSESTLEAQAEMNEISSQQSMDGPKQFGQIRGAQGIELLLEDRNKLLMHPAKNFLLAKEDVGRQKLALAAKFYPDERILHYVGEDQRYRVLQFRRADIRADLRVMMVKGEVLTSPGHMRARVQEMVSLGVLDPLNNPDDRESVLRALEFRSGQRLVTERLTEQENQEREIDEMIADPIGWMQPRVDMQAPMDAWQFNEVTGESQPPVVQGYPTNPYDDDQIHAKGLKTFMRSQEYRDLPPATQSLLLLHLEEHERKIQAAMMQELMLQQALQGAPGEKGTPSKPRAQQPSPMTA